MLVGVMVVTTRQESHFEDLYRASLSRYKTECMVDMVP